MIQENIEKIRRLRGKWYSDGLDTAEYDNLVELENAKAEDEYWGNGSERRNDF